MGKPLMPYNLLFIYLFISLFVCNMHVPLFAQVERFQFDFGLYFEKCENRHILIPRSF